MLILWILVGVAWCSAGVALACVIVTGRTRVQLTRTRIAAGHAGWLAYCQNMTILELQKHIAPERAGEAKEALAFMDVMYRNGPPTPRGSGEFD